MKPLTLFQDTTIITVIKDSLFDNVQASSRVDKAAFISILRLIMTLPCLLFIGRGYWWNADTRWGESVVRVLGVYLNDTVTRHVLACFFCSQVPRNGYHAAATARRSQTFDFQLTSSDKSHRAAWVHHLLSILQQTGTLSLETCAGFRTLPRICAFCFAVGALDKSGQTLMSHKSRWYFEHLVNTYVGYLPSRRDTANIALQTVAWKSKGKWNRAALVKVRWLQGDHVPQQLGSISEVCKFRSFVGISVIFWDHLWFAAVPAQVTADQHCDAMPVLLVRLPVRLPKYMFIFASGL